VLVGGARFDLRRFSLLAIRRLIALAVFAAWALVSATRAHSADDRKPGVDDLSPLLAESVSKHKLPGMGAAVIEGGRITAIGAAGVRCRGHKEKITVDDRFHIGSDTKSMTATLIAVLVEQGKLRWDSTPLEVLSERGVKKIDPAWRRVTLQELLTHRGGVRPNPEMATLLGTMFLKLSPREQRLRVCRAVLTKPPDHEPGKGFLYSNTGYVIAGAMAEAVADDSWENLMVRLVFKPLGIEHAGFGSPGASPTTGKESSVATPITEPWGHESNGLPVPPGPQADNPPCLGPAGRVHLTLADWARFATLHLSAGQPDDRDLREAGIKPLLSAAALRKLQTPFGGPMDAGGEKYAMGWGVRQLPKSRGVELVHAGSNTLWFALISIRLSENQAILIVTNQGGDQAARACAEVKAALVKRAVEGVRPNK
jgi:CubicO group peptidase (beta-lactamase class C family)